MAAVIKSGNSTDELTVDPTSKAARVTLYTSNGSEAELSTSGLATETTLAAIKAQTDQLSFVGGGKLKTNATSPTEVQLVDGSATIQPVSGPLTDSQLRASAVPVSGTFYPATQPISGSVSISGSVPVTGTFFQATQPISGSVSVSNFPGTQPISGSVSVSNFPASQAVTGTFFQAIQPTTASDVLTKGTQGATGFSVQDLKDAGRSLKSYTANLVSSVTAEAMITLTPQTDGTVGTPATSFTITSGKRLRIQNIVVTSRATAAAVARSTFFLRMSTSGAVTTASTLLAIYEVTGPAATAITGGQLQISLPDGLELVGTQQFGMSHISPVATHLEAVTILGYEY